MEASVYRKTRANVPKDTTVWNANSVSDRFHSTTFRFSQKIHDFLVCLAKCIIPCLNGGRCKGVNKCRCPRSFRGDHCEIGQHNMTCTKPCRHGICYANNVCVCDSGWAGKLCNQREYPYIQHIRLSGTRNIIRLNILRENRHREWIERRRWRSPTTS